MATYSEEGVVRRTERDINDGYYHVNWNKSLYDIVSSYLEKYGDNEEWQKKHGEPEYIGCDGGLTGANGSPHTAGGIGVAWANVAEGGAKVVSGFQTANMVFANTFGLGWDRVTVNQSEVAGLAIALATAPEGWQGILVYDSRNAFRVLSEPGRKRDWVTPDNVKLLQMLADRVDCTYSFTPGHTADTRESEYIRESDPRLYVNHLADRLAKAVVREYMRQVNDGIFFHPDGTLKRGPGWSIEHRSRPNGTGVNNRVPWNAPDDRGDAGSKEGATGSDP